MRCASASWSVGVPLIILSGSRSAWLAIAAGFAIGVLPWAWRQRGRLRRPRRLSARGILLGVGALAVGGLALALVLPRLTAVTSLVYRGALWRDTLVAWSSDPLLGIGPGFMPYARQAAAADFSFPVRQPHSHNLPLGVLGDAGLVGLAAGLIVVGTACCSRAHGAAGRRSAARRRWCSSASASAGCSRTSPSCPDSTCLRSPSWRSHSSRPAR